MRTLRAFVLGVGLVAALLTGATVVGGQTYRTTEERLAAVETRIDNIEKSHESDSKFKLGVLAAVVANLVVSGLGLKKGK